MNPGKTRFSLAGALFLICLGAHAGDLVVRFHGLESLRGGRIMAGLYASRANAFKPGYQIASVTIDVVPGERPSAVFRNLPAGEYAVSALHDEDGDGAMKTGFLGFPLEGYGFSSVKKVPLGRPPFDSASIHVGDLGESSGVVYMRYP